MPEYKSKGNSVRVLEIVITGLIVFMAFMFILLGVLILESPVPKHLKDYGGRKQQCYPNKTCDTGFSCIDDICIKPNIKGER